MAGKALLGNVTDNDLRLLRVFRAVVACGGFAAAELEYFVARIGGAHILKVFLRYQDEHFVDVA